MFDIGFSELLVIGVVALIVIGPEKQSEERRTLFPYTTLFRSDRKSVV